MALAFIAMSLDAAMAQEETGPDTNELRYPFEDPNDPLTQSQDRKLYFENPSNVETEIEYNPETGNYEYRQKIGDINYRNPSYMTFDEYKDYQMKKSMSEYWKQIAADEAEYEEEGPGGESFRPSIQVNSEKFDRIFGGNTIDIRPTGSAELIFGLNSSLTRNPAVPVPQQRVTVFDFRENIQLNVIGSIGEKLKLQFNYNTQATFDFENQMKLEYTGFEDEIIQKIELGNVSLPLQGSLITGSQSLFGVKTQLKFGRLTVTSVYSQQKSERKEVTTEGGAQEVEFELPVDEYEANRHYFLSHFFRDLYEPALQNPPIISSSVNITRIEVWVTNTNFSTEQTRNLVAFQDLGEGKRIYNPDFASVNNPNRPADNGSNNIYSQVRGLEGVRGFTEANQTLESQFGHAEVQSRFDYLKVELARKLEEGQDFTVHPQLGYISLIQELQPNQALAVAFEYTYNGQFYQVGEFSNEATGQKALILKLLKSTELNTRFPMWDLMMKNVYNIGAYQLSPQDFEIGIWYLDRQKGIYINYLPIPFEGLNDRPLLQVLNLDRINGNNAPVPDGEFDFLASPQITVNPTNGRIFFPQLEPFGSSLRETIIDITNDPNLAGNYSFDSLYTNTQANAQYNFPAQNRFQIRGKYQSSNSSEISLNAFNIPEGSVTVTAGGAQLVENQDYTVDYNLGRVKIINQSILQAGVPIKVALESNSAFAFNRKSLFASRFDYKISDNLNFGGTIMNLSERPVTQKINVGDEPISNTVIGIDGTYSAESQFLTTLVDKIPLIDTKEKSMFTITGEAARLFPGHSKAIGKEGNSYIDDFEGSQSTIDLRSWQSWSLASTPQGQLDLFAEGNTTELEFNKNRALFNWHTKDILFYRDESVTPDHIRGNDEMRQNHFMREVLETEVFPNKEIDPSQQAFQTINMLDLSFYPTEIGPYNYDVNPTDVSAGLNDRGKLASPETRWGGIMRRIDQTDFDAANIEYIQFWLMDPYAEAGTPGFPGSPEFETDGYLYFNLGNISEDILRDDYKSFENGFPTTEAGASNLDNGQFSNWGRVPETQQIVNAFDIDPASREYQDVGLDGLRDEEELLFFEAYIAEIEARFGGTPVYDTLIADPSHDNFNFYRDDDYDAAELDILERYKFYNGLEGNSPTSEQYSQLNAEGYPAQSTTLPDGEDINRDNTLDATESYYQYRVRISPEAFQEGQNYITSSTTVSPNNSNSEVTWYQFKIPIREFEKQVGNISDFRSIRFMRMFLNGFEKPVHLRFARLELVRGEWRRYTGDLDEKGESIADDKTADFNIGAVNIEENASKSPVNYVLPPQIFRERQAGSTNVTQMNEQSLSLTACGLQDGQAEAAFRNVALDVRSFGKMEMFVHAESADPDFPVDDKDIKVFIRIGTDFTENYYEYETPVTITPPAPPKGYLNESIPHRETVWPLENNMEIAFEELFRAKRERNEKLGAEGSVNLRTRYEVDAGAGRKIYVVGNPNLADAKVLMIGVRNPGKHGNPEDDGLSKCVEVWVNELRLTEFNQTGGEAAIGRVSANLADFASVSLSGNISTPGWGSLDAKVSERQRETIKGFDASAQVELGKFLPEETGIKVPMYVGYSQQVSNPEFAPAEPDTPMELYLADRDPEERDSLKKISQTFTERKSLNFTNVRKEKTGDGKAHFYDVSNLSATYAFTETNFRDYNTEYNFTKTYRGGLAYSFTQNPKVYEPLRDVKFLRKAKYLRLLRDFNFSLLPKTIAVQNNLERRYGERKIRNLNPEATVSQPPYVNKSFNWTRAYNLSYDITKSLKFDFSANNQSLIREYEGERVSKEDNLGGFETDADGNYIPGSRSYELHRDSLMRSLRDFGLTTNYNHNASLSYNVPINKIPILDWTNVTTRYTATYDWQRGPLPPPNIEDTIGNTISNAQQIQINASLNMTSLYNKVPFLRDLNRPKGRPQPKPRPNPRDTASKEDDKKDRELKVLKGFAKTLMAVKNISGTYSQNRGITLPGFTPNTQLMGLSPGFEAPGWGFVFGQQDAFGSEETHFADWAGNHKSWLVKNPNLFNPYLRTYSENINLRASVQPVTDLRIDLTASQTKSENWSEYWTFNDSLDMWSSGSTQVQTGNYTVSFWSFNSAFAPTDSNSAANPYNQFLKNRLVISGRLGDEKGIQAKDSAGYTLGYGSDQQDVLIPAFIAAYAGTSENTVTLNPLKLIPLPGWRVSYNGLNKLDFIKKYFKSITVNHAYRSTYSVGNYQKTARLDTGFSVSTNVRPGILINTVSISEQFAPLINFDMTWLNSLLTRVEIKRDRNVALSMSNVQITETANWEYIIGSGYTIKQVRLPFEIVRGKTIKSDLTLRADFGIRDTKTQIYRIVEQTSQASAGQKTFTFKFTADYTLSERLNLRFFYDWVSNQPKISNSFPTANTNAGFSLRFTLAG